MNKIGDITNNQEGVRINKFLSDSGVCSRREADKFIEEGKVTIDGEKATLGSRVFSGQSVVFNGKELTRDNKLVLIAYNKPVGVVCTTDRREPDNVIDAINYGKRIYPIGRLDKDSEGLLLLTNDGDIVNKILRAGNNHEKEYIVEVNKMITTDFLKGMANGVPILDTVTKPCRIEQLDRNIFRIVLTQGLNRQIRRMCEFFGYRVLHLRRVRIMNINLGHLQVGGYRNLSPKEIEGLNELISDSSNLPLESRIRQGYKTPKLPEAQVIIAEQAAEYARRSKLKLEKRNAAYKARAEQKRNGIAVKPEVNKKEDKVEKRDRSYGNRPAEAKKNSRTYRTSEYRGKSVRAGKQGNNK